VSLHYPVKRDVLTPHVRRQGLYTLPTYMRRETENVTSRLSSLTWPPNSPDLNPVDYAVWGGIDISQGSAATHLRCDGIFSDSFITNFLTILTILTVK